MRRTWTVTVMIQSPSKDRCREIAEAISRTVRCEVETSGKRGKDGRYLFVVVSYWGLASTAQRALQRITALRASRRWRDATLCVGYRQWWRDES